MADRFSAQIWIGGQISRTKRLYPDDKDDDTTVLRGLISALNLDRASHEYGDAEIDFNCTEEELLKHLDGALKRNPPASSVLRFRNDQAVLGEFPETEQFCIENDIPFDRNSDHYCEYDAETVCWRPGMESCETRYVDSAGRENVDGETVRKAMELLTSYQQARTHVDGDRDEELLEAAEKLLKNVCPELPPDLEPFEVI